MSAEDRASELQQMGTPLEGIASCLAREGFACPVGSWSAKSVAQLLARRALAKSMDPEKVRAIRQSPRRR